MTPLRCTVLAIVVTIVLPAVVVGAMAAGVPFRFASTGGLAVCLILGLGLARYLPATTVAGGRGRALAVVLWVAVGLIATYRITSLSSFMYDANRTGFAFDPSLRELDDTELGSPFYPGHNCFTCYIVGAHLAGEGVENLYDGKYYRRAEVRTPIHDEIGEAFSVDTYQYPPPFLLLPAALSATGAGFHQLRACWFGLNVCAFVATMVTLLWWTGGRELGLRWVALPAVLASPIMLGTLQIQNVHLLIITLSLLALPAFARSWNSLGGALLGFAIVSKLFPGLLLVFLLLQKRWRAVGWTCAWMLAYCAMTWLAFGAQPFFAFVHFQMPRLASGEAFGFATTYFAPLIKNGSALGIAYKLEKLGLLAQPAEVARIVLLGYSALLVIVLLILGLRRKGRGSLFATVAGSPALSGDDDRCRLVRLSLLRIWLVLLVLGQIRSPFLPWTYGNVAGLLLLAFLLPNRCTGAGDVCRIIFVILLWVMLSVTIPLPFGPTTAGLDMVYTLIALGGILACCAAAIVAKTAAREGQNWKEPGCGVRCGGG